MDVCNRSVDLSTALQRQTAAIERGRFNMRTTVAVPGTNEPRRLHRILLVDGLVSGTMGVLLVAAAQPLADWFGLSGPFVRWTGLLLVPFALSVLFLATRSSPPQNGVWALIALNVGWVVASAVVLLSGWINPSGTGVAFIIAQAILVALFAEQQYVRLRQIS
jgi:hypothetical protein